jgi:membrane associated rhomboid family serine protease
MSQPAPSPSPLPAPSSDASFAASTAVRVLIAASAAVMFLQFTVFRDLPSWLAFDTNELPQKWFAAFTYMFAHVNLWHLAANMYGLFLFGPRLEQHLGARKFAWFYILCGLGGVVFQMLLIRTGTLIGASAAVFGVMTAYAMQWPEDEVYLFFVLPLRVRTLVVGLLVFNLVFGIASTGEGGGANVAYLAHLGGVMAAYVYMRVALSSGIDQVRQRVANLPESDEPPRAIPRNLPRRERGDEVDDIVAKSKAIAAKRAVSVTPTRGRRGEQKADELNRVLDKISEQGIESLTSDERKVLEEMSKRLRNS